MSGIHLFETGILDMFGFLFPLFSESFSKLSVVSLFLNCIVNLFQNFETSFHSENLVCVSPTAGPHIPFSDVYFAFFQFETNN